MRRSALFAALAILVPLDAASDAAAGAGARTAPPAAEAAAAEQAPATFDSSFISVGPARLADTRAAGTTIDGLARATGRRLAGTTLRVPVLGRARIPSSGVGTVVLHVAAVSPSSNGHLTAYPCGIARPTAATVNFERGRSIQNLAIVRPGGTGDVCIYTSAAVDVVVDVTNWTRSRSAVVPVAPARLADTRPTGTTVDGVARGVGRRAAATTLVLPVLGRAQVPAGGVGAVVLHVTAIAPSTAGYLTAYACGAVRPVASSVRFAAGQTIQSLAVVPPGPNGTVCVYTSAATDIVVDVAAWTRRSAGFIPLRPARLLDTTPSGHTVDGLGQGGGLQSAGTIDWVPLSGRGGLPYTFADAAVVTVTAVSPLADGHLTLFSCDQTRPAAATVNFVRGRTIQNTEVVGLSSWSSICVYASAPTHVIVDVVGWAAPEPPPHAWASVADLPTDYSLTSELYGRRNWATAAGAVMWRTATGAIRLAAVDTTARTLTIRTYAAATYLEQLRPTVVSFAPWDRFGGLYVAPTGDLYLAVGRSNLAENDALAVIEVRRYDPSLHFYGAARITGGELQGGIKGIYVPFEASAADMLLVGNRLVVHSGRLVYAAPDGLHHQTNFTFEVAVDTMIATSFNTLGGWSGVSYTSHSFRQMLTKADDALVMVDHGDAYPRSIVVGVMANYPTQRTVTKYEVFPFNGRTGDNFTGATLTATVSSGPDVLVAGTSIRHPNAPNGVLGSSAEARNVYVATLDTDTGTHAVKWLTSFAAGGAISAGEPRAVQVAPDRFALLIPVHDATREWTEYRLIDHAGVVFATARFDDLVMAPATPPVLIDGRILWLGLTDDTSSGVGYVWVIDVHNPAAPVLAR